MKIKSIGLVVLLGLFFGVQGAISYARPPQQTGTFFISYGQSETEFLNFNQQHIWEFTGAINDIVTIDVESESDPIESVTSLRDPVIELRDSGGELLIQNDDGGEGLNSRIEDFQLPSSGTFFILVRAFNGSNDRGLYRITLQGQQQPCNIALAGNRGALPYNSGQRGSLGQSNRCGDRWTFDGTAGDRVTIAMNSSAFDTYLELWRGSSTVTTNDDGGEGLNSLIEDFVLPQSGTYTIWARSFGHSGSGAYSISLSGGPPSCNFSDGNAAGTIPYNSSRSGTIGANNRCGDRWTFSGRAGDIVVIAMNSSDVDSYLELYSPNGQQAAFNDDGGTGLNSLIDGYRLPANGTYTIWAHTFAHNSLGNYSLSLSQQATPTPTFTRTFTPTRTPTRTPTFTLTPNTICRAVPLFGATFRAGPGTQHSVIGPVTTGADLPIVGRTGDNIWWQVVSNGQSGWLANSDIQIQGNCSNTPIITSTPTPTPTILTDTPTPTGTPEIACPDLIGGGRLISYDETVTGTIEEGCTETWLFSGTEGDDVTIETLPVSGLDTVLQLYDINNNLIAEDDNSGTDRNARIETELPHTGEYVVVVSGFGSAAGGYTMSLALITVRPENPLANPLIPLLGGLVAAAVVPLGAGVWYVRRAGRRRKWQRMSTKDKTFPKPCDPNKTKVTREPIEVQPALWGIEHVHYQILHPTTGDVMQRRGAVQSVVEQMQDALYTTRWNNSDNAARESIISAVHYLADDITRWLNAERDPMNIAILIDVEGSEVENEFNVYRCQSHKSGSNWKQVAKWTAKYKDHDTRPLTTLRNLQPGQPLSSDTRWELHQLIEDFLSRL